MPIEIVTVSEHPSLIPQVAQWLWQQWARHKGRTLEIVTTRLATRAASTGPEQTFVILDAGTPVATASFVAADLASRPDLTPWLASVFVAPPHRGQGHAARLVRRVEEAARAANTETYGSTLKTPRPCTPISDGKRWDQNRTKAHQSP